MPPSVHLLQHPSPTGIITQVRSVQFSSVAQSCPTLPPHGLQHARPPCPSPTPRVYSNSCPLSQWCHPTVSSPSPPTFSPSQHQGLFRWVSSSHQVEELSASASVLPVNIQDWSPLGWTGWISLQSNGLSRVFSNTSSKASILWCAALGSGSIFGFNSRNCILITCELFVCILSFHKEPFFLK